MPVSNIEITAKNPETFAHIHEMLGKFPDVMLRTAIGATTSGAWGVEISLRLDCNITNIYVPSNPKSQWMGEGQLKILYDGFAFIFTIVDDLKRWNMHYQDCPLLKA